MMSGPDPAALPMTSRMGRSGYVGWAPLAPLANAINAAARTFRCIDPPPVVRLWFARTLRDCRVVALATPRNDKYLVAFGSRGRCVRSIRTRAGRLDDRPPARDLRLDELAVIGGRHEIDVHRQRCELLDHVLPPQDLRRFFVESRDDRLRRFRRHLDAVPVERVVAGNG